MANIVLIEDDPRLIMSITQLIGDLEGDHRLKVFKRSDDFSELYFKSKKNVTAEADEEESEQSLQLLSTIDLMIIKHPHLPSKKDLGIEGLVTKLKYFKYFPENRRTKIILTKYEEDGIQKIDLLHPFVDDLIYLPIDRLIFLQKIEILLALPSLASPSYLFSQEIESQIEVAKLSQARKISDWGCAISNPVPLIPGLLAHFYLDIPGEDKQTEVFGKVIHSEKEADDSKNYLVYFSFLGLNRNLSLKLRKLIATKTNHFELFKNSKREDCSFNPDHLFLVDEDKRHRNIVVIDLDRDQSIAICELITREMDLVKLANFASYQQFMKLYFDTKAQPLQPENVDIPNHEDLLNENFSIKFDLNDLSLKEQLLDPEAEALFLGFEAQKWPLNETIWLEIFGDGVSRQIFDEQVEELKQGKRKASYLAIIKNKQEQLVALKIHLARQEQENTIARFEPCDTVELKQFLSQQTRFNKIDLFIIGSQFIPSSYPSAWLDGLENLCKKHGLIDDDQQVQIIICASEHEQRSYNEFKDNRIKGLIKRPVEAKTLMTLVGLATQNPYSLYHFFNMNWVDMQLPVQLAREAKMTKVSEYGITIRHPRPIQPGTFLFLRKQLFDQAPRKNLCARVYACSEDPTDKGSFVCHLTYFGINDAFLKFARSSFREAYAQSKGPGF